MEEMDVDMEIELPDEIQTQEDDNIPKYDYLIAQKRYKDSFQLQMRREKKKKKMPCPNLSNTCMISKNFENITSEFVKNLQEEETEQMIIKQVEFYLSDENLCHDLYLRKRFINPSNKGLKLKDLIKFNQVKRFFCEDSDEDACMNILKKCIKKSALLKLTKKEDKVIRKKSFCLTKAAEFIAKRTLYISRLTEGKDTISVVEILMKNGLDPKYIKRLKNSAIEETDCFMIIFPQESDCQTFKAKMENHEDSLCDLAHCEVYTKEQWDQLLLKTKDMRKMLSKMQTSTQSSVSKDRFAKELFVFITGIPEDIQKYTLRSSIDSIQKCKFLHYSGDGEAKVRFEDTKQVELFLSKCKIPEKKHDLKILEPNTSKGPINLKISRPNEEEYECYLLEIQNSVNSFQEYKKKCAEKKVPTYTKFIFRKTIKRRKM
ncbi:unnamed protein product [Moneuplotes crassus]|uniref:HTH La-type RNA-binding domain-containing protein n=1 Tax=Euplotes crassus TaxID=5936 RepID=A0AAD1XDU4_EUPCR|nr:unnamed protein product [Moneuplotes crassus]